MNTLQCMCCYTKRRLLDAGGGNTGVGGNGGGTGCGAATKVWQPICNARVSIGINYRGNSAMPG